MKIIFRLTLVVSFFASVANANELIYGPFDEQSFSKLRKILDHGSNVTFSDQDFLDYKIKIEKFDNRENLRFNQKDIVLHSFGNLVPKLWQQVFESETLPSIQIELYRNAPKVMKDLASNPQVSDVVRNAAKLSIYGTENTPAIISEIFVNAIGGISSAYSTLYAEKAMVYEGYRPSTYNDLIIAHEGFHSAMRLISTINRMNRLVEFLPTPLTNGIKFDANIEQDIRSLETLSAPNLEELLIDSRFTSDHHGVIMAVLHHGVLAELESKVVDYDQPELFDHPYPFHYIAPEQSWDEHRVREMQTELKHRHHNFLMENFTLQTSLEALATKVGLFNNVIL